MPRRAFLMDAARVAAADFLTVELQLLAGCARDASTHDERFVHLTSAEGRTLRAFAAQILPSDNDAPGAADHGTGRGGDCGAVLSVDQDRWPPRIRHPRQSRASR